MVNQINEYYVRDGKKYEIIMPGDVKPGDFIRTHMYEDNQLVKVERIFWRDGLELPYSLAVGVNERVYRSGEASLCLRLEEDKK